MLYTPLRSLDDLSVGQVFEIGQLTLSQAEIVDFASRFDPQYFHLDPEAAKGSLFHGLVASGLHTLSSVFGAIMRSGLLESISLGGNRIDCRWPAPLHPDEEIAVRLEVMELRPSKTRPTLGVAKLRYVAARVSDGVVVLDAEGTHFLLR